MALVQTICEANIAREKIFLKVYGMRWCPPPGRIPNNSNYAEFV